ncbi:hypothetical protein BDW60DRAFT_152442 [Aspergillus nidulans var. acristatus]|jgi:hypothetical protein
MLFLISRWCVFVGFLAVHCIVYRLHLIWVVSGVMLGFDLLWLFVGWATVSYLNAWLNGLLFLTSINQASNYKELRISLYYACGKGMGNTTIYCVAPTWAATHLRVHPNPSLPYHIRQVHIAPKTQINQLI